ncbi:MAG: 50S ribosomal protein L1, partial [Alphaproteobacteria bacterium]
MTKVSKRFAKARAVLKVGRAYALDEAVKIVKQNATAKFNETIEVALNLNVDPRHADQMVRGVVQLPNGTGKTVRVAVFAKGPAAEEATKAGADIVGAEELIDEIAKTGKIDFDVAVATPDMMSKLAKVAKILGPKGIMPNPKTETVSPNVKKMVEELK